MTLCMSCWIAYGFGCNLSDGIDMVAAVTKSADDLSADANIGLYSSSLCFPLLLLN